MINFVDYYHSHIDFPISLSADDQLYNKISLRKVKPVLVLRETNKIMETKIL